MKTDVSVLEQLHALTAADRAWIIARLPAQTRAQLLASFPHTAIDAPDALGNHPGSKGVGPPGEEASALDLLAKADAKMLAEVLQHEPPWVIAVLLAARIWSWAMPLLEALPPTLRSHVVNAQHAGSGCKPLVAETLARLIAPRLPKAGTQRTSSGFEEIVMRLSASRAKKRMSLHL